MGILDSIDKKINPLRQSADAIEAAVTAPATPAPIETKTPQQTAYETKEKAMNRSNPYYQNVDNSGLTKESLP